MHQSVCAHSKFPGEGKNLGSMGSLDQNLTRAYFMEKIRNKMKYLKTREWNIFLVTQKEEIFTETGCLLTW